MFKVVDPKPRTFDFKSINVAYIDADILVYRALAFTETEFDGEIVSLPIMALSIFNDLLNKWLDEIREKVTLKDYYLCVTVGKNFRHFLYADYKAQRAATGKHPALDGLKAKVRELDATLWEENIEADDLIAIHVTKSRNAFAVSADKDFLTVPATTYFPRSHGKTEGRWEHQTLQAADRQLFKQAMMGDSIDNYKGIHRCGDVKATKVLERAHDEESYWRVTLAAFLREGYTKDYALTMVRLARILRHGEYDFDTKKISLWEPKNTEETV